MAEGKELIHLHELLSIESNNTCFDCGSVGPTWASLSHGSFICLTCSGVHRGFGLQISFVKSITMDSWTSRQLLYMKHGGNANLKAFFDEYKIMDLPLSSRYKTEGAAYYRRRLRAIVDGTPIPPALDPAVALQPESQISDYYTNTSTDNNSNPHENKKFGSKKGLPHSSSNFIQSDVFNSLGSTLGSFVQTACSNAERTFSDIQSSQVFDNAKGVFETGKVWFKDKSKKLASQLKDPEWWEDKESKAKVGAQKVANQLTHAATNASEWFQRFVTGIPSTPHTPHPSFEDSNYSGNTSSNYPVGVGGGASLWNSQPKDLSDSDPLMSHFKKPL